MALEILTWIRNSSLAEWINSYAVVWPTLETIHFVSLCVLFGAVLLIDLRLIGFYKERCAPMVQFLIRVALAAFATNFATGVLFIFGNTFKYVGNAAFNLKMFLILVAGINALYYKLRLSQLVETNEVTAASIAVGYLSLLLWSAVIVCGRMITFFAF